jgi:hypothetical protein
MTFVIFDWIMALFMPSEVLTSSKGLPALKARTSKRWSFLGRGRLAFFVQLHLRTKDLQKEREMYLYLWSLAGKSHVAEFTIINPEMKVRMIMQAQPIEPPPRERVG